MENLRPEEENIIKDVRNLFRLEKRKKKTTDTTIKGIRNPFRIKKENEHEEENYYKPVRVGKFRSNNYVEDKSNCKIISVKEYNLN